MESIADFLDTAKWPNTSYLARQTNSIAAFLRDYEAGTLVNGNQSPYQVGDMFFLTNGAPGFLSRANGTAVSHVGIVLKGGIDPAQVLITQISYSSEGFYNSNDYHTSAESTGDPNDGLGELQTVGRFEVITLQTYLYKHLSNSNINWLDNPANHYANGIPSNATEDIDGLFRYTLIGRLSR